MAATLGVVLRGTIFCFGPLGISAGAGAANLSRASRRALGPVGVAEDFSRRARGPVGVPVGGPEVARAGGGLGRGGGMALAREGG